MLPTHDRNTRRFEPMTRARLIEGEYEEPLSLLPRQAARWMIKFVERERDADLASRTPGYHRDKVAQGWATLLRAVRYLADQIEFGQGARVQTATRTLGSMIKMSQSTASRCLRRLCAMNLISRYREHRIRLIRARSGELRIIAKPAVYEVVTHSPPTDPEGGESRLLTRGDGRTRERPDG